MESRIARFLLHAPIFVYYVIVICYDVFVITPNIDAVVGHAHSYGGKLKYLTFWDMCVQCIFFAICTASAVFERSDRGPLKRASDFLFGAIALPVSMFVFVSFWGLYAIDRELIYPRALDDFIPTWVNHAWHTAIVAFLVVDSAIIRRQLPARGRGGAALAAFGAVYISWLFWVKFAGGVWVYPVFAMLSPLEIAVFVGVNALVMGALYLLGNTLHAAAWSRKQKPT
ncbi:PREDICTED: androgen-induced gene 1 protein-like [Priapulus caudatus]|uniref:Androgen-induced gene 1 protein-like n=1 Tax=Priapulus caudatus TaxID=37621 RepID=A0ABM1F2M0_PRICU|nr:PREDICTED: androgen-induced gene 1 protein-like [Priapulus caudatus]